MVFPGNKIQLYGVSFAGGGNGGIPQDTIAQLSALRFTAVKTLEDMLPSMTSQVPAPEAFRVSPVSLISVERCKLLHCLIRILTVYYFVIELPLG